MKRVLLLVAVVLAGVLVVLGAKVLLGSSAVVSVDLVDVAAAQRDEAEPTLGPLQVSTSIRVGRLGQPRRDLVSTWSWREPGGQWQPLEFEGLRYFDADGGEAYAPRRESTGVRDGRFMVEASHGGKPVLGGRISSALILCEVDGALAVHPWHLVVTESEAGSGQQSLYLAEPLVLPAEFDLPPLADASMGSSSSGSVDDGEVEGEILLRLKDRRHREREFVFEFRVQVETVDGP